MHLFGNRVFTQRPEASRRKIDNVGSRFRALAVATLTLASCMPSGLAQQTQTTPNDKAASNLPAAPAPIQTEPSNLRQSLRDFSKPSHGFFSGPIDWYRSTTIPKASFDNSTLLSNLLKDGKIYLSLSDAIALALQNNYDIAIARYNLDIADTDILRARAGSTLRGVNSGVVTNTEGGTSASAVAGGGPGGTTGGAGGAASGTSGIVLSTSGSGPLPTNLDPNVSGTIQFERQTQPSTNFFTGGTSSNNIYDFTVSQGFQTGTNLQFDFNNTYATTSNSITLYSPQLTSTFRLQLTQHLLQGAGIWVNRRLVYQAINDRRITNAAFRQQILYTVNQVENIYWGLVSAYEDVQAKERALDQSTKLDQDTRKQLQIGTMAPLDVVNADANVASDKQALISSQSNLNYQQQIIKQAIARNLNDPALESAPVIPTDRISTEVLPEESEPVDTLVKEAFKRRPELEQAVLALKNDAITLKGARNALLPTFDVYGFLGGTGIAGSINPNCDPRFNGTACDSGVSNGWGTAAGNAFNLSAPNKGVGFQFNIPLRNRTAQADQARSLLEYRQAELYLEQLYTRIRMQVVNAQFALTNDRAQVNSALAARDYAKQSLDAEEKKLKLGASTTANVLLQERNLATAENNLISAHAAYAKDRAGLYQVLATTLEHYGINLNDAVTGNVTALPVVPGLEHLQKGEEPTMASPSTN
ncbi:MAG: TolC family protein [Acidobacteriota bacterium]|nr:TolC family protein [Acidobacteriota bacterium]